MLPMALLAGKRKLLLLLSLKRQVDSVPANEATAVHERTGTAHRISPHRLIRHIVLLLGCGGDGVRTGRDMALMDAKLRPARGSGVLGVFLEAACALYDEEEKCK